jgi:predicted RNA polymerase sigma factor
MPGPVVELNRAVATSMAFGPQAGLDLVDALAGEAALSGYHLLPSVRAAAMTRNTAERDLSAAGPAAPGPRPGLEPGTRAAARCPASAHPCG